jgi:hypothetical protein
MEGRTLLAYGVGSAIGIGAGDILALATTTDSAGDSIVTGGFSGTANFNPTGSANLTSAGSRDVFVAKYSPAGALIWAESFGGTGTDLANALAIDGSGNLYLAGSYQSSAKFGATTLTSAGSSDAFVAKLDGSGNVLWVQSGGGTGYDQATAIAVDNLGNVIASGQFQSTAQFGSTTLTSAGSSDAFVVKYSSTGAVQWARSAGGPSSDTAAGVATDTAGNVFVTGRFAGAASFSGTNLTSAGSYDAYLEKLDGSGNLLWVHSYGGTGFDQATAVAVDSLGNAYFTGQASGTATLATKTLSMPSSGDGFIAEVNPSGSLTWAVNLGSSMSGSGNSIAIDSSGTITVAGQYQGSVNFPASSGVARLNSFGGNDAFVVQLNNSGAYTWGISMGGAGNDTASGVVVSSAGITVTGDYLGPASFGTTTLQNLGTMDIFDLRLTTSRGGPPTPTGLGIGAGDILSTGTVVDSAGNSYLVGGYSGTVDFNPNGTTNLTSAGGRDVYVAKYAPTGSLVWAKSFGGMGTDIANAVAIDGSGYLYIAGSFQSSANFGSTTLTSAGSSDAFVAKLDGSGNVVWAQSGGGTGFDQASAIDVDGSGNVIITGQFQSTATFGSTTLTSAGSSDAFVAKYSSTGAFQWAHSSGGPSSDTAAGVTVDTSGNIYIAGRFAGTASFNGTTTSLTSAGSYDAYLEKLNSSGSLQWVHSYGGASFDQATAVAVDGSGNAYITGQFTGPATFGATTLPGAGSGDVFVAKVSATGALVWAQGFGSPLSDTGTSIFVDSTGTVTVAGQFQGTMSFPGTSVASVSSFGGTDAFVVQLSNAGAVTWAVALGGAGNDTAAGVAVTGSGSIVVTGNYIGPALFESLDLLQLGVANAFVVWLPKHS